MHSGRCECGAVRFKITGPLGDVTLCHCSQCRRRSGYLWGSVKVPQVDFTITEGAQAVTWHSSSDWATRGFCSTCGSQLFYRPNQSDYIAVAAGALDQPTGLKVRRHIFTKDQADFVEILDAAPQIERY